jgi:glycine/D-amino acid oxidase-like deaminating enzyme
MRRISLCQERNRVTITDLERWGNPHELDLAPRVLAHPQRPWEVRRARSGQGQRPRSTRRGACSRSPYGWAGTFGETEHALAYIGAHPGGDPGVHYALGCRGNGIAYSAIAAEVLNAAALGKPHRYRDTFAFDR